VSGKDGAVMTSLHASSYRDVVASSWSLRTSFGLVVAAQVLLFAGSNLPTPLFPLYEHRYGFGPGTVTLLFSSYVAVLVPTLAVVGQGADRIGRRPLLVAGVGLTCASSAIFAVARSVEWLFAGEIVYGIASALVMSCVSIAIRELHPTGHLGSASLAASVAMAAGMVLGPLTGGLLAEATPWPTTSPYVLDIVLALPLAVALARIPETRPDAMPTSSPVRNVRVPADIRSEFTRAAVTGAATFMVIGWVFGLSPSFLHDELGVRITRPIVGGAFAAMVAFTTGASQLLLRRRSQPSSSTGALLTLGLGMAMITASSVFGSVAIAIVGGVVAGTGAGIAQVHAMAVIQVLAPTHARTAVMSRYATCCYVALSLPVILAGQAAERYGLAVVTGWYLAAVLVIVAIAVAMGRPSERTSA